jgi:hypothetical protein
MSDELQLSDRDWITIGDFSIYPRFVSLPAWTIFFLLQKVWSEKIPKKQ